MAQIIQVLLFGALFLSIYGQHHKSRSRNQNEEDKRISNLINLSSLLQTAARLAYPITASITSVVGSLAGSKNYAQLQPHKYYNSYDRQSVYASGSRGRYKGGRNNYRPGSRNMRIRNGQNANRRHSYKPNIYDYFYDYEYDYDYDKEYLDSYESSELDDIYNNYGIQSTPDTSRTGSKESIFNDADIDIRTSLPNPPLILPFKSTLGFKDVKANNEMPLSTTEVVQKETQNPILSDLGNQRNYPKPLTNSNGPQFNYITSVEGITTPGTIPNVQNPLSGTNTAVNNNGKTPGNVLPALNDVQPNIIYVVLKPDGIDHEIDVRSLSNNHKQKPNGDALNIGNGFYIPPPNVGLGATNANNPAILTPADVTSAVDTPVSFMPANCMGRLN